MEANRAWAERAPVLGLVCAKETFTRNGKANRHGPYDAGAAMGAFTVQAMAHGLFVHQMGGFDPQAAREAFAIPEDFTPMAAFALGHPGEVEDLPESLREAEAGPRTRHPASELFFEGAFGTASELS